MSQEQHFYPKSKTWLVPKPKRTLTLAACVACRKRKSKVPIPSGPKETRLIVLQCDGNRPTCPCCLKKRTACVFDVKSNERPSQAIKRRNGEMQVELLNLRRLWTLLQSCTEQQAPEILGRIRAQPSSMTRYQRSQDIADFIRRRDFFARNWVEDRDEDRDEDRGEDQIRAVPAILSNMARPGTLLIDVGNTTER